MQQSRRNWKPLNKIPHKTKPIKTASAIVLIKLKIREFARDSYLSRNVSTLFVGEQERIRKEVTEQYTVKIEELELKLKDAEAIIKGNFCYF